MSEGAAYQPSAKDIRMVIAASSAGTIFEWYDFFIYGTLAAIIGQAFFPSDNATLEILLVWARSEEHTSELQSLMRISYAVFCLKKKKYQVYCNNTIRPNRTSSTPSYILHN